MDEGEGLTTSLKMKTVKIKMVLNGAAKSIVKQCGALVKAAG